MSLRICTQVSLGPPRRRKGVSNHPFRSLHLCFPCRLTRTVNAQQQAVSYGYDPAGYRFALTNGNDVTRYVMNPNAALPQVSMRIRNGVTSRCSFSGAGGLIGMGGRLVGDLGAGSHNTWEDDLGAWVGINR